MDVLPFAVVPILPTMQALSVVLSITALSLLGALAALLRPSVAGVILRLAWRQKIPLLLLGSIIMTVWWARGHFQQSKPDSGRTLGADWPAARGGLNRCGAVQNAAGPAVGGVVWSAGRRGEAFYSSPAVVANRVYAVGSKGDRGCIHAFDLDTGRQLWQCQPVGFAATFSSPVVVGDLLLVGEGLHHTKMARVICVDRTTGQVEWTFQTNGHVECTPTVDQGRVYIGAGADGVYCLELDPAIADEQRLVWHAPGSRYPDAETCLAVGGGFVYVGLGLGGECLCRLDADSGEELGRLDMPYPVFSPPSIQDEKLYVGMGAGDYLTPLRDPAGQVCCVDLKAWRVDWTFPTPATVLGAVVATEEDLVFACADGNVYTIDRSGQLKRKWNSYAPIIASPAVAAGRVYVVNQDGMLYGLGRRDLEPVWQHRLGNPGRYVSSPTVAGDSVIVGTEHNRLLRVGRSASTSGLYVWPGDSGGAGAGGSIDDSPLPSRGYVRWQYSLDRVTEGPETVVVGPVAFGQHCILVPIAGEEERGLACLNQTSADSASPSLRWFLPSANKVVASPAVAGQLAFFVDGMRGDQQRSLCAVDLESGQRRWRHQVAPDCSGALTVDHSGVLVQANPNTLSLLGFDGQAEWSQRLGDVQHPVTTTAALVVVAVSDPALMVALDRPSGQVLWQVNLKHAPVTSPVLCERQVLIGTGYGVEMRRLVDGQVSWRSTPDCGGVAGPLAVDDDRFYFVNDRSTLVVAKLQDGRVLAKVTGIDAEFPPLVAPNGVMVRNADGLMFAHHDLWLKSFGPWCASQVGGATHPAVLHEGDVFLGIEGYGLACFSGEDP
jgi:outer membrane protein assembly factor BamB